MGREAIKIPQIRSVYGDQILCDGGPFGVGRQGGSSVSYYPVGADCVLYHAYWDGTATDHSTSGNDGTVVGASFVENGIELDGTDDYIWVADHASLNPTDAITIYEWIYLDILVDYDVGLSKTTNSGWNDGYFVWFSLEAGPVRSANNGVRGYSTTPRVVIPGLGQWFLVAVTYDKVNRSLSINAGAQTQVAQNTDINAPAVNLQIGRQDNSYNVDGKIGEVLIYNSCQTTAQITSYYNATKARYGL